MSVNVSYAMPSSHLSLNTSQATTNIPDGENKEDRFEGGSYN